MKSISRQERRKSYHYALALTFFGYVSVSNAFCTTLYNVKKLHNNNSYLKKHGYSFQSQTKTEEHRSYFNDKARKHCYNKDNVSNPRRNKNSSKVRLFALVDGFAAKAAIQASAKLLTSIGVGGWAARKATSKTTNHTVLDTEAMRVLSKLAYWLFQPALLLWAVATTLNESLQSSTVSVGIPLHMLRLMLVSALLHIGIGFIAGQIVTKVMHEKLDAVESQDVLMCTTFSNAGPLPLIFSDALFAKAPWIQKNVAGCISFYLLVWVPLFWTFGRIIFGTNIQHVSNSEIGKQSKRISRINTLFRIIKRTISPPIVGALVGLLTGFVPVLRICFFGEGAVLAPMMGAAQTLGAAYLPAAILILAGSLFIREGVTAVNPKKPSVLTVVLILFARFVISPIVSFGLLNVFQTYGWLIPTVSGYGETGSALATFTFVLLMEGCMPPTQNSVIMLQLDEMPDRAAGMARLLTVVYSISLIPVTCLLSISLSKSGIMSFN